jgi:hypothetical protein
MKVDADTGEEVPIEDIVKGYALDKGDRSDPPPPGAFLEAAARGLCRRARPAGVRIGAILHPSRAPHALE